MRELFIYYRVRVENFDAWRAAVLSLQAQLQREFSGLRARVMIRPDSPDGWRTCMETYAQPSDTAGIGEALQRDIETAASAAVTPLIEGSRHTESFVACVS